MRFFLIFLIVSLGFSTSEKEFASSYTFASYHSLNETPLSIEFSVISNKAVLTNINAQWWPSENLSLNTGISLGDQDETEIYYHIDFGFSPKWKLKENMSTIFYTGMNRLRFHNEGDFRWIHIGILESITFGSYQFELSFSRLRNSNFNHDISKINLLKTLKEKLTINAGVSIDKIQKININSFIGLRISL